VSAAIFTTQEGALTSWSLAVIAVVDLGALGKVFDELAVVKAQDVYPLTVGVAVSFVDDVAVVALVIWQGALSELPWE